METEEEKTQKQTRQQNLAAILQHFARNCAVARTLLWLSFVLFVFRPLDSEWQHSGTQRYPTSTWPNEQRRRTGD